MKKNILFVLLFIFLFFRGSRSNAESNLINLSFKKDINCSKYDLEDAKPILKDGRYVNPYQSFFDNEKPIPVPDITYNGDYVRTIMSYSPDDGTPINLLTGSTEDAKPLEQVVRNDIINWEDSAPVISDSIYANSVGKVISQQDFMNYQNNYGNSRYNNRGSLLIGN